MPPTDAHHDVLIVGGGTAGITVAARLQRAGQRGRRRHRAGDDATTTSRCGRWSAAAGPRSPRAPGPRRR